jgi:hypothetical protein
MAWPSAGCAGAFGAGVVRVMQLVKTTTSALLTLLTVFALQLALAYQVPHLGLTSPFPFTILRSFRMPIFVGIWAGLAALFAKSWLERKLFYSVVIASAAELVTVATMVSLAQPLLMLVIFFLNAFMTVQLLKYGVLLLTL